MCPAAGRRTVDASHQGRKVDVMNASHHTARAVIVLLAAGAAGAAVGFASSAVAAPAQPIFDPPLSSCVEAPETDHVELEMPPSDFLRGTGRTAPVPH